MSSSKDDESGAGPLLAILFLIITLFITGWLACNRGDERDAMVKDNLAWATAYNALNAKYEGTMCTIRGLTLTTVKGITLCMDPATKALHKIDSTAD